VTKRILIAWLLLVAVACAPRVERGGPVIAEPSLEQARMVADDGAVLPLRRWLPEGPPKAVILALHGFNDYSNAFDKPAALWAARGIATYAYDQRGFGAAPHPGIWSGTRTMVRDVRALATLLRRDHPGTPLFLLGVSMGGAVAMVATADAGRQKMFDGVVMVAPAVWGRRHMGAIQRGALWLMAHTVPWFPVSGQGLGIKPSDNIPMLRALSRDPLVLKQTRIDAVHGLIDLMDAAFEAAPAISRPTLILYGRKDEIIPSRPTHEMLRSIPRNGDVRAALYNSGYHMLLRGLDAATPLNDIAAWIIDRRAPLPSGADKDARKLMARDD